MILLNKALTGSFVPSDSFVIQSDKITLAFSLVCTGGPSAVEWYWEFSDDLIEFNRETTENITNGTIAVPEVVRTFKESSGANLADGTHKVTCEFVRHQKFARVQIRTSAGAVQAIVKSLYGLVPNRA